MNEIVPDRYHVLICDDDESYRASQMRMLNLFNWSNQHASFKVYEAESAEEAMDMMSSELIDCVLLDFNMPDIDGVDAARMMLQKNPELSIIIVTGAGSEMTAVEAMKVGAMDYLRKGDIVNDILEKSIINAVSRSRMQHKIAVQAKELLEAERHRVMLESLTAACHHLSQPVTVIRTFLVLLKRKVDDEEIKKMVIEAYEACEKVADVLFKLSHFDKYRTETYLKSDDESFRSERRMLKL